MPSSLHSSPSDCLQNVPSFRKQERDGRSFTSSFFGEGREVDSDEEESFPRAAQQPVASSPSTTSSSPPPITVTPASRNPLSDIPSSTTSGLPKVLLQGAQRSNCDDLLVQGSLSSGVPNGSGGTPIFPECSQLQQTYLLRLKISGGGSPPFGEPTSRRPTNGNNEASLPGAQVLRQQSIPNFFKTRIRPSQPRSSGRDESPSPVSPDPAPDSFTQPSQRTTELPPPRLPPAARQYPSNLHSTTANLTATHLFGGFKVSSQIYLLENQQRTSPATGGEVANLPRQRSPPNLTADPSFPDPLEFSAFHNDCCLPGAPSPRRRLAHLQRPKPNNFPPCFPKFPAADLGLPDASNPPILMPIWTELTTMLSGVFSSTMARLSGLRLPL
ncbi:hypothetical protein MLD38_031404 [Melastoma candidum]|uniref:Uncharacterized protein n=2 Tax=Melastoma candidum TaxID=119954 RepID=A0ACB9MNZ2_9MYRT|nr:hypothetical protein MLD38_037969 [Melastoma candidum]KAI4326052.1 hypothetical protein MLD38_031404 [Melastoma candidum]